MEFGVNLNNREPLITSDYTLADLLDLALEWATLDQLSGGRTILGAWMGNPEHGVRREFEALGLPSGRRAAVFEEGLAVLRAADAGPAAPALER